MAEIKKGSICRSTAGHDKGTFYIIVETEPKVMLSDGKKHKLSNPKTKNPRHLMVEEYRDEELERLIGQNKMRDENIKFSIKKYLAHSKQ